MALLSSFEGQLVAMPGIVNREVALLGEELSFTRRVFL
jgi:hypothetical protein